MGNLLAPWLAGIVYETAGYYAVFAIILAMLAFDFILRVVMIEKGSAAKWLPVDKVVDFNLPRDPEECRNNIDTEGYGTLNREASRVRRSSYLPNSCQDVTFPLLRNEKNGSTWLTRTFPRMTLLLHSPRMLAATWGAFTYAVLISFLDATLPVFVKLTFHWSSKGAGLIFIAVSGPSLLGTLIGRLSDRFGTRKVAAVGFALIVPPLAVLGMVKDDDVGSIVLSCCLLVLIGQPVPTS